MEDLAIYYYTNDRNSCEINFIVSIEERIIPLEVKAEINLKAKSLQVYKEKFKPEISIHASMSENKKQDSLINFPLYMIENIGQCVE